MTSNFKGCVRYFNRCTNSPTYILYQLNEKMSLQSLAISSFTLSIAIFERGACRQSASLPQATLGLWIYNGKLRQARFEPELWHIRMSKRIPLPQLQNYYPLYWKMKSSNQVYFINIRLFGRIVCKSKYFRNLLQGVLFKILYFQ